MMAGPEPPRSTMRRRSVKAGPHDARGSKLGRNRRAIGWGFVDQSFSSVTNLGLSLLAGRLLGPAGLGRVFLAFSIYLMAVSVQRRLLTEPLLSVTSALDKERRARSAERGLTMCLGLGALCTAAVLVMSATFLRGFANRGLLLSVPWLVPALVQDYWRNVLFREKRAAAAAVNDGVWFAVMILVLPLVWQWRSDWLVMAWWGVGASTAAVYGFFQTRSCPSRPGEAWRWFRKDVWPFGKWNVGAGTVESVGTQLEAFVVLGILGAAALGGLRAASTVFAPLSIIIPAIALPGLPAMARAHARGEGRKLAIDLSAIAVVASVAYSLMLLLGGWRLLPFLFGGSFSRYRGLIWPVMAAQTFAAAQVGFMLLIKAQQRGRVLVLAQSLTTVVGLAAMVVLSLRYGLVGVAWGGAAMNLLSMSVITLGALRGPRPTVSTSDADGSALRMAPPASDATGEGDRS